MATYAIGDVQGCIGELETLLASCSFDVARDRIWFAGDLVNRGPASVEVLRFVKSLGDRATTVLGNHDLHLLCLADGVTAQRKDDTLEDVLCAPDRHALLGWLRTRPLLHVDGHRLLVHAGLLPQWSVAQALVLANEVHEALQGPAYLDFLSHLYGSQPNRWDEALAGPDRLRVIVNAMTRMRFCTDSGEMEFRSNGGVSAAPAGYRAWFDVPGRMSSGSVVVCGHWSAEGLRIEPNLMALDTGCVWGGALTAIRVEDRQLFQVACSGYQSTGGD